ncbi:MAG: metallophosphoesterase family protein [Candidatus Cohnella colombiensis]|uniref:Metallophosphoesterase family protein n=1 Tax=Candidatus Cohnella colombiensis TaxID=3121368 RepID=A0AA95EU47_9BACL|nr:MAG: metallophosphoesterase family protein [Cohnella sp.]
MGEKLRFRNEGTFKIAQFTDLHWCNGKAEDKKTRSLMEQVIIAENPDLIVFTGDIIESLRCKDPLQAFEDAVSVAVESGIPWAAIFGNHDSEGNVSRQQLMNLQLSLSGSVAESGPSYIGGVGNYVIRLFGANSDDSAAAVLYFFDSGSYSTVPSIKGYDWVKHRQVEWFSEQANSLKLKHQGIPMQSLAFLHIPLPEYREVWERQICYGHRYEKVSCPQLNSGLFTAMVEAGGVQGVFCGHDHNNDYIGSISGIKLCYGRSTGYNTYGRWLFQRGARIIELHAGADFTTWLRLANGKKVTTAHKHKPGIL